MALISGTKTKKQDFFLTTRTALARGYLFLTGDRPSEQTFRDLQESIPFFKNYEDRAKEEDFSSNLEDLQGLIIAAADSQVIDRQANTTTKSWAVQPSQVTEVDGDGSTDVEIGSEDTSSEDLGNSPYDGTVLSVSRDTDTTSHNLYIVSLANTFLTWFGGLYDQVQSFIPWLVPSDGDEGDVLTKTADGHAWNPITDEFINNLEYTLTESLKKDTQIVVVIDTTSLGDYRTTINEQMQDWYDAFTAANPWYQGGLTLTTSGTEEWLKWPRVHGLNAGFTDVMMLAFIDESNGDYHTGNIANIATEGPTTTWRSDFDDFVGTDYPSFNFFKGIVYGVPANGSAENGCFHAHSYKAIQPDIVTSADFIESPLVVSLGSSLDFMETFNPYAAVTGSVSADGTYSGLLNYGWIEYHDFGTNDINTKLTAEEFDNRIQTALFGAERVNTITVELVGTYEVSGETISDIHEIDIPVAQIDFGAYKDLPNPTSASDIDNYADGTLYYLTVSQMGLTSNSIMSDDDKVLFVVNT